jgi:asparagine synthase (glutamine-hydrolysing)
VASAALAPLANVRLLPERLPQRFRDLTGADNTTVIQTLFCWLREKEHRELLRYSDVLPIRRLFEPQWERQLPRGVSRLEQLSMHATEANVRLSLPNDFLFKVDTASMKESLEIRVPLLDEDLFNFGLSIPHRLKVKGGTSKRVLRAVAGRRLPPAVATKPKWGFVVPLMDWVDLNFKERLKDALLGSSSKLPEFFEPKVYRPMVEAFCAGHSCKGISNEGLYNRSIMFLSLQLALCRITK